MSSKKKRESFVPGRGSRPGADSVSEGKKPVNARIWIGSKSNDVWLNAVRVQLLECIDECGSIAAATRVMNMSYAHAWKLVESMNAGRPQLVQKVEGGQRGGGAKLTPAGQRAVRIFRELNSELDRYVETAQKKLEKELLMS